MLGLKFSRGTEADDDYDDQEDTAYVDSHRFLRQGDTVDPSVWCLVWWLLLVSRLKEFQVT